MTGLYVLDPSTGALRRLVVKRRPERAWRTIVEARAAGHYVSPRWPLLSLGIASASVLA